MFRPKSILVHPCIQLGGWLNKKYLFFGFWTSNMPTNCRISMTISSLTWLNDSLTHFLSLRDPFLQYKPFRRYVVNVGFILGVVKFAWQMIFTEREKKKVWHFSTSLFVDQIIWIQIPKQPNKFLNGHLWCFSCLNF